MTCVQKVEAPSLLDDEKTDGAAGLTQNQRGEKNMRFSPIRHSTVKAFVLKCYKCRKSRVVVYVPNWAAGTRENLPQSPESLSTGGREEKIPHRAN